MKNLIPVDVLQDNRDNWYLIPVSQYSEDGFYEDLDNTNMSPEDFENKYAEYRIEDSINEGPQLYADINLI